MTKLTMAPLEPFGVELRCDLREPLSPEDQAAFREAVLREGLVLVRGQQLTMDDQARLMSCLGPLLNKGSGRGYVAPDDGVLGAQALDFHSDLSFTPEPFLFISLHAVEVADGASWTRFANGVRAFERLPADLKARVDGQQITMRYTQTGADILFRRDAVMRRPGSPPILYVNRLSPPRFDAISETENDRLLAAIWERLYAPDNVYHHDWRAGDLVVWDNLALQHARPDISAVGPRRLQRVVVARKSLLDQVSEDHAGVTYEGAARQHAG